MQNVSVDIPSMDPINKTNVTCCFSKHRFVLQGHLAKVVEGVFQLEVLKQPERFFT